MTTPNIPYTAPPREPTDINLAFFRRGLLNTREQLSPALGDRIVIEQKWRNVPLTIKESIRRAIGQESLFLPFNTTIKSDYTVIPATDSILLSKMSLENGTRSTTLLCPTLDSNDPAEIAIQKQISPELFKLYSEFFAPDNGGELDEMNSNEYALILSQMLTRSDHFSAIFRRNLGPYNSNVRMQFETTRTDNGTEYSDMIAYITRARNKLSAIALRYHYDADDNLNVSAVSQAHNGTEKQLDPAETAMALRRHFRKREFLPLKK